MTHQLTELECTGNVARDNHRGGETCDGQCRCELCWYPEPTDREVIAQLRTQLRVRDLQLKQQNQQCEMLLSKLAELRRERAELRRELKSAEEEAEAAEYRASQRETPDLGQVRLLITSGQFCGLEAIIDPDGKLVPVGELTAKEETGR